ncbi:MAG: OmpA family protein [Vicinamibacterales bacterium]|nr:OmpA family protein [Vicinamibacterales bacterium]
MGDAPAPADPAAAAAAADQEFEDLRALLVQPEREALRRLEARLDARDSAREVASVLPEAVAARGRDPRLVRALTPSVEEALLASARRDPRPLADALFPVLAPAIRNAIAHALSAMVESMGRVMEHSVSWRALGWRLTALRTGRPYAEVVLLNTLVYQVEQVFLIHREGGLLLQHVAAPSVQGQSPETVSAMLTAIRDFVNDSFGGSADDAVNELRVGDRTVYVEQGPHALLAAVVRGTAPPELRRTFQDALDTIHLQAMEALRAFDGDDTPFVAVRPVLEQCLSAQQRERGGARRGRWLLAGLAVAALVALAWWGYGTWQQRQRDSRYLEALRTEPGLVVVSARRTAGRLTVSGLRDPLARDPIALAAGTGLGEADVEGRWTLYHALEPAIVLARATGVLRPPAGVSLDWRDGALVATGAAPAGWVEDARRAAPLVAGVARFDAAPVLEAELARIARALSDSALQFERGGTALVAGQDQRLRDLEREVAALDATARVAGRRLRLVITGHADSDGRPEANVPLSRQRAAWVRDRLALPSPAALDVVVEGAGSSDPAARGGTEQDKARNRRVSFRAEEPGPAGTVGQRP